jgi:hypothetical protein
VDVAAKHRTLYCVGQQGERPEGVAADALRPVKNLIGGDLNRSNRMIERMASVPHAGRTPTARTDRLKSA